MSEQAASVAEQAIRARTRRRGLAAAVVPVATLFLIDLALSVLAFVLAYKLRHDSALFVWRRKLFLPVGVSAVFEPYLSLMLFVPIVKTIALRK